MIVTHYLNKTLYNKVFDINCLDFVEDYVHAQNQSNVEKCK